MSKKIAVIEDNKTNIKLIRYQLEMEDFDVHIEETGAAGLKMIKNQKPDMVILDIGLPDIDGFELCKTLRKDKVTKDYPIIMLTAKGEDRDKIEGLGGPLILVGSSMGAWIMIHVALAFEENKSRRRVVGLMGIAAAPDFTKDLLPNHLGVKTMKKIFEEGVYKMFSDYSDEPYIISKELIQDGNQMCVLKNEINIDLPVRLIHGTCDKDVPWDQSRRLMQALISEDVELILVKGGNHRLSNKNELERIFITLASLVNSLELEDAVFEN